MVLTLLGISFFIGLIFVWFGYQIERRVIYLFVFFALAVPILLNDTVKPAKMNAAKDTFDIVENWKHEEGKYGFIALDFGPNTKGENSPQSEVMIEHLMRKRIPFVVFSYYLLAEPFLESVPQRVAQKLEAEHEGQTWTYGKDWINLGYKPGGAIFIQSIAKADNLLEHFGKDAKGTPLKFFPTFAGLKTIRNVGLLGQFTGLASGFGPYVQFFQTSDYVPTFVHGCTSISVPDAYIYLDSGQLSGLFEGLAGSAWYSFLLKEKYTEREPDSALVLNTALGCAHLVLIGLILLGNISYMREKYKANKGAV